jgi:hypothetical protein
MSANIILQFAESTSLGGRIIEWYDHGRFAHVDTVLPDGSLLGARDDTVLGVPSGVQIRPANYLPVGTITYKVALETSEEIAAAYHDFIVGQIGKPYDETAIIGFVSGRNWYKPDEWFCSELVTAGLVQSGYLKPLTAPANKIAPDDLLLVLSAINVIFLPPQQ